VCYLNSVLILTSKPLEEHFFKLSEVTLAVREQSKLEASQGGPGNDKIVLISKQLAVLRMQQVDYIISWCPRTWLCTFPWSVSILTVPCLSWMSGGVYANCNWDLINGVKRNTPVRWVLPSAASQKCSLKCNRKWLATVCFMCSTVFLACNLKINLNSACAWSGITRSNCCFCGWDLYKV